MFFNSYVFREEITKIWKIPRTGADLKDIHDVIQNYTSDHYAHVTFAFCALYIL